MLRCDSNTAVFGLGYYDLQMAIFTLRDHCEMLRKKEGRKEGLDNRWMDCHFYRCSARRWWTHHPALVLADVGGVEFLHRQTLLLHVEAPQPVSRLAAASALGLQHTPAAE